jgi:hypothetical protein
VCPESSSHTQWLGHVSIIKLPCHAEVTGLRLVLRDGLTLAYGGGGKEGAGRRETYAARGASARGARAAGAA